MEPIIAHQIDAEPDGRVGHRGRSRSAEESDRPAGSSAPHGTRPRKMCTPSATRHHVSTGTGNPGSSESSATGRQSPDASERLLMRVDEIWTNLVGEDPERLAANTHSSYTPIAAGSGEFRLCVWGREVRIVLRPFAVTWVDDAATVDPATAALIAYYFETCDGAPESRRRIAFRELHDGAFYSQAFQGYTGHALARTFGGDTDAFATAAEDHGGLQESFADLAFAFRVLPLVSVAVACWFGDDDFGPSYRILFDAAVGHHLPTDVCAVVGSDLTRRLIDAYRPTEVPS